MIATFFTISPENITAMLGYAGDLVGNFMPLLAVVIGILIGAFVIRLILKLKD
jgi:putative exporter of polyketide antibiotics